MESFAVKKRTKQALNKNNIRLNLSKYLSEDKIDSAITDMWNNREESHVPDSEDKSKNLKLIQ